MTQSQLIERWVLGDPMFTQEPLDNGMLRFRTHTIRWHQHPRQAAAALRYNGHVLMQPTPPGRWCVPGGKFNGNAARDQHARIASECYRQGVPVFQPPMTGVFGPAVDLAAALIRRPEQVEKRTELMQMAFLNGDRWYHTVQWEAYTFVHDMFPELPRLHPNAESLRNWIELAKS